MRVAGLIAQTVMGIVFLVAGLPKTLDPALFYWDAVPYAMLFGASESTTGLLARAALVLGPVECVIGMALLMNWGRALVFPVATALMAFFTVLVTMAWAQGYDDSCGCFGTILERGADMAVVEDVVMLGLLVLGWFGARDEARPMRGAGNAMALTTVACLVVGIAQLTDAKDRLEHSDLMPGVSLADLNVKDAALREGEKLIVVMTPTCVRCRRAIPRLNDLATSVDIPLIGLTPYAQDSAELTQMREALDPKFSIKTISRKDLLRLAWGHGVPRMALLREGEVVRVWEAHELPADADELASIR